MYKQMAIEERLKKFINARFLMDRNPDSLNEDTELFSSGIIDSIGIMELINFVEQNFEITFTPRELDFERFETIKEIKALIENKVKTE